MTTQPLIEKITKACIAANPDIKIPVPGHKNIVQMRDIRLVDVLLALKDNTVLLQLDADGCFYTWELEDAQAGMHHANTGIFWDLKNDNLQSQPLETLQFIASLLPE